MDPDRSLLGDGPYPITGPMAILARTAFLAALAMIVVAVFLPREFVPQFVRSHYLQHFAAFYVAGLLGLAASPRARITTVALRLVIFTTALEASHLLAGARVAPLIDNWVADIGGLAAAFAPLGVARFRRRFETPPDR
ncbi:MAG: hypothetical protein KKE02_03880 [Alphaproteobacteria bacterium]|nr:hypothetical protein [Alphaproteobacteria bacterium]MBU1513564.1 hypothetical protein [Alphaproteobacteria bacterium]MBU2094791.1 hypothetical protein [Alphaproteobacteria bacterium]MBU2150140.1 hypothetical protein [Alphaproteobacteria bacterium]MBU2309331.1 hypothetical protein [Alphaproteobacteria bacterium]